ncbi:Na+/H+ antiporter subunit G [bacterium]|nr:Na+/H+ antiporter subunit G [bacterium]
MFWDTVGYIFIVIGVAFDLLGCVGLVRLPDVYNRLQAATKCVTLGTAFLLFGVFFVYGFSALGIKALLCALFVLISSPTGAHALARGSHKGGVKLWEGSVIDLYAEESENK